MSATTDPARMTPYELCALVSGKKGSLNSIAKEIKRSKAYVSILRKIDREGVAVLIGAWSKGAVPFDLVREIVWLDRRRQKSLVKEYLRATRNKNKQARGTARASVLAEVKAKKNARTS